MMGEVSSSPGHAVWSSTVTTSKEPEGDFLLRLLRTYRDIAAQYQDDDYLDGVVDCIALLSVFESDNTNSDTEAT